MAVFTPWIANFLVRALDLYVTPNPAPETVEDSPFKYEPDNSNLTITTRDLCKFTVCLLEVKKNKTQKVVEAYASDGEVGVNTTFVHGTLDGVASKEQPALGAVLELHNFEIRLADYVEPPRVTLHLRAFEISDTHVAVNAPQSMSIHEHNLASQYLRKWKSMAGAWIEAKHPDSPTEIRSQVGDQDDISSDGDDGNRGSTLVSQTLFATQVPLRCSPKAARGDIQKQTLPKHHVRNEPADKVTIGKNDGLLQSPVKEKLPSVTHLDSTNDVASTVVDLTQRQLVVLSSSGTTRTLGKDQPQECDKDGPTVQNKGELSRILSGQAILAEPMPEAVSQLFRYLRKECHDGRYVPRRLQVIPRDQAKLLGSDDCWQPPLVGRAQRLGTVPLDLLNRLTERTDFEVRRAEATDHSLAVITDKIEKHGDSDQCSPHQGSAISSDEESEQVSLEDWPPTPIQARTTRQILPPDSSPLGRVTDGRLPPEIDDRPAMVVNGADVDHTTVLDPKTNSGLENLDEPLVEAQHELSGDDVSTRPSARQLNCPKDQMLELLPPSTFENDAQLASPMPHKTIQVKRTPFHNKETLPVEDIPDSSANIVPGTFDESSVQQSVNTDNDATQNVLIVNEQPLGHHNAMPDIGFVDGERISNPNRTTQALPDPTSTEFRNRIDRTDNMEGMLSNHEAAERSEAPTLKRSIDHTWPGQSKRIRRDQNRPSKLQARDSDYSVIDEDRIRYRRSFMSRLSKRQDAGEHVALTLTTTSGPRKGSIQGLSSSSTSTTTDQNESLNPYTSLRVNAERGPKLSTARSSDLAISTSEEKAFNQLYSKFKTVYADYGGQEQNFEASCLLLRRLYLQREATHPSLWDDFVFRHFHDYRDYLRKVIECGDSALPYQEFYSIHVEQPTHLQRVIKPSHIDRLESTSTGNVDHALTATSTTTTASHVEMSKRIGSDRLMATDTSAMAEILPDNISISNMKRTHKYDSTLRVSEKSEETFALSGAQLAPRDGSDGGVDADDESLSRRQEQSQNSQTSVKRWLDRAAGAESPILGTPETSFVEIIDSPMTDFNHEKVASNDLEPSIAVHKKRRTLPWTMDPTGPQGSPPLFPNENAAIDATRKLKVSRPVSTPSGTLGPGSKTEQKAVTSSKPARSAPRRETQRSRLPLPTSSRSERAGQRRQDKPETAFARFARFYNDLASEQRALKDLDRSATKQVDMFSWRN